MKVLHIQPLYCQVLSLLQGIFQYQKGRTLPLDFRKAAEKTEEEEKATKPLTRKDIEVEQGYIRCDNLDMKKLKKYVKEVADEISLYRLARQ